MESQLEIVDQLKKTLELLSMQKSEDISTESWVNTTLSNDPDQYYKDFAHKYIDFIYENPTTYHTIEYAAKLLKDSGFTYVNEKDNWNDHVEKYGKYFTVRNGTNLVAFVMGKNWKHVNGVGAIGTHIDSLAAKLKPASIKESVEGFQTLGVAPYGGSLNELWFDRDLGLGGRVLYKKENSSKIEQKLVDSTPAPIARIPSLAPHFGKPAEGPFDKEDKAVPVMGYCPIENCQQWQATDEEKKCPLYGKHSMQVLRYVAKMANIKVSQIVQLDLDLFDVQKGVIGGINNDFLIAPRMDDKLCSFAALWSLVEFAKDVNPEDLDTFSVLGLFDNEEVGSLTRQGARGGFMEKTIERAVFYHSDELTPNCLSAMYSNSIILSADVNHMFNPNFAEVYMKNHSPKPNVGVTLSLDPNAHMATDTVGLAFVEELARKNGDKVQYFQIKNNSRSGGTVGPFLAAQTGARTIDLGIAQLAMHSIRATTGCKDVGLGIKFFQGFYKEWRSVYDNFGEL
ncbi:metalloaminopeptidase APE1 KNAG_0A06510 [Huiozyma naganishii CBS 8797]|uniref:Uncharacterized protein n=1 Tax=Huiozyma naganishii (strain ATCC MYA-139 / BCRC 22969 / CBS 8797 / KCTC 17520 / NBRC 10181 / NCYC 3082 / Yp74L-3) TaxID=1071383 RepID=J7S2Q7_HUIN7|nr:hypothetical protein KNAG_0A06510 [Kazachstania naganishii CBS 8797]CCK68309.1 hypothetical protein KNAG_0A06510 [Kazachstania naganishii CBS 8797]